MNLFDNSIADLREYINSKNSAQRKEYRISKSAEWPAAPKGTVVLGQDTAVELGNPRHESASFMLWSDNAEKINEGRITIIGPDLNETNEKNLPFGKVVLIGLNGMTEDNCYERHRQLELTRYDLKLTGYMMRAVSQYGREWSRVSREAIDKGFNFTILGSALAGLFRKIDFVDSVELLFVTSSPADVRELGGIGSRASRLISALNKMSEEMSFECGTCDFVDVCSEVEDLRNIRNNLAKDGKNVQL